MKIGERSYFAFNDLTIDVSWKDRLSEKEIGFLLSIVPFLDAERSSQPADIDLQFSSSPALCELPLNGCQLTECYGLSIYHGTTDTVITDGESSFSIAQGDGTARIAFHRSFSKHTALAKSNFFLVGLIHLLAQYGYYDLHGAGLINNGCGVLFLGPSGSGKSSLALNLVKEGWHYASDDSAVMKAHDNHVSVLSFRKNFYVDPTAAERFPELKREINHQGQLNGDKYFIDLQKIWPGQFQAQLVPGKIIFCQVSGKQASRIRPLTKKDALLRLLPQSASIFFNQSFAIQQIDTLKQLIEQADCYHLEAGFDVYDDPHKAAGIVSSV